MTDLGLKKDMLNIEQLTAFVFDTLALYGEYLQEVPRKWQDIDDEEKVDFQQIVEIVCENKDISPEELAGEWRIMRQSKGWKYGPKFDEDKKEGPIFTLYVRLDNKQRRKWHLLKAIVHNLTKVV